jgi:hypothetical protein
VRHRCRGAGSSDGIVGAIESDRIVGRSRPGGVAGGANYGEDFSIGVGRSEHDSISPRDVTIVATIDGRSVMLSEYMNAEESGSDLRAVYRSIFVWAQRNISRA